MKRFRFSLETLLRYRRTLLEQAEGELRRLRVGKDELDRRGVALEAEKLNLARGASSAAAISGGDLRAVHRRLEGITRESEQARRTAALISGEIEKRLADVVARRTGVKLIETLRSKEWKEYQQAADRRIEAEVSELHLIGLQRDKRARPAAAEGRAHYPREDR
jgi:flagellar export protein FliJ